MQRQGVTGAGMIPVRRDDNQFGDLLEGIGEHVDAPREVAVVIAEENSHVRVQVGPGGPAPDVFDGFDGQVGKPPLY